MAFKLDQVVPWGRSFEEYLLMFNLKKEDLNKRNLGCSDGPASFNSVLTRQGGQIVSLDPLYGYSRGEIQDRINKTFDEVVAQVEQNKDEFIWSMITTPTELGQVRMAAMQDFLYDFEAGWSEGRYVAGQLPDLPFQDDQFDLTLCSHFLFLYSEQLSFEFHVKSIEELCRVARDVRLFPLLELGSETSRHLTNVLEWLDQKGYHYSIESVNYEFQKGGDKMLRVFSAVR